MNGKKARKLRQKAKKLSLTPELKEAYITNEAGSFQLDPLSTKGIYRALKKAYLKKIRTSRTARD